MVRIGLVGVGYWGPKLLRNLQSTPGCQVVACCDRRRDRLEWVRETYPDIAVTENDLDLIDADIDAVVIATPVRTHYALAKAFLSSGKHVLVEKPMTQTAEESRDLIEVADANDRILMVGHTYQYKRSVQRIRDIIARGELGNVLYVRSTRAHLGLVRADVNVIWDLAPHDISIITYVLDSAVSTVSSHGLDHLQQGVEDFGQSTIVLENGTYAFIHNSWINPDKVRSMSFIGTEKMLVWEEDGNREFIKLYEKETHSQGDGGFSWSYGDIHTARLDAHEALGAECEHFIDCVKNNVAPLTDGRSGLTVVEALEASNISLRKRGAPISVSSIRESDRESVDVWNTTPLADRQAEPVLVPTQSNG